MFKSFALDDNLNMYNHLYVCRNIYIPLEIVLEEGGEVSRLLAKFEQEYVQ